jgi:hypothetical protein
MMSPRPAGRTQACGREHARIRLTHARAFLDAADLIGDVDDDLAGPNVAAALAVLAGIAAADAACCFTIGRRSRGHDHRDAIGLLSQVEPDGTAVARDLARLLDIKDGAHYGMIYVTHQKATAAIRQARRLLDAAERLAL